MPSHLPTELLNSIFRESKATELKALRRVSKSMNVAVSPLLFSHLVINAETGAGIDVLSSLAREQTSIGPLFRSVEFQSLGRASSPSLPSQLWRWISGRRRKVKGAEKYLPRALSQLVSVTSVSIAVNGARALAFESADMIFGLIASLPQLSHLTLGLHGCDSHTPLFQSVTHQFHGLQSIHLEGGAFVHPEDLTTLLMASRQTLTNLRVDGPESLRDSNFDSVGDVLRSLPSNVSLPLKTLTLGGATSRLFGSTPSPSLFRHLQQLDTLHIHCDISVDFWHSLRASKIHLRQLTTYTISDAMLAYLQSYSGLKSLTIDASVLPLEQHDTHEMELLGAVLYQCVLPKHRDSLGSLHVVPPHAGDFCLKSKYMTPLLACQKLTTLKVGLEMNEPKVVPVTTILFDAIALSTFPHIQHIELNVATPRTVHNKSDLNNGGFKASEVRGHHYLQDLLGSYQCLSPSTVLRRLTVNSGHMGHNVLVQRDGGPWGFQLLLS